MASLQAYQSHGIRYYRIVESFRKDGKPAIRVLAHLGRVDDILECHQQNKQAPMKISSVSAGAVTALLRLAQEFDIAGRIDRAIDAEGNAQVRDGLTVGQSSSRRGLAHSPLHQWRGRCAPRYRIPGPGEAAP